MLQLSMSALLCPVYWSPLMQSILPTPIFWNKIQVTRHSMWTYASNPATTFNYILVFVPFSSLLGSEFLGFWPWLQTPPLILSILETIYISHSHHIGRETLALIVFDLVYTFNFLNHILSDNNPKFQSKYSILSLFSSGIYFLNCEIWFLSLSFWAPYIWHYVSSSLSPTVLFPQHKHACLKHIYQRAMCFGGFCRGIIV